MMKLSLLNVKMISLFLLMQNAQMQSEGQRLNMRSRCAGLVFLAFALNLVDCGGLLGGRLGDSRPPRKHRKSASMQPLQGAGLGERTLTCKF